MSSSSSAKAKAKQPNGFPTPAMSNPAAGSANPSASFSALWGYIQPAIQHIMTSPTNDATRAPPVDVVYHMGVHTATYNYFTSRAESGNNSAGSRSLAAVTGGGNSVSGTDLYEQLDKHFAEVARDILLNSPQDDATLIHYLMPCFSRYNAGAQSINRLLNYVNRHYVKRAVDEDRGWLRIDDVLDAMIKSLKPDDTHDKLAKRLRQKRTEELAKWGYDESKPETFATAEAHAEAASSLDCVVPLNSAGLRRFRTEIVEPLLAVPKPRKAKGKKRIPKPGVPERPPGPRGRLACAVKVLLESQELDKGEQRRLATELASCLQQVGIRSDHALRKKLDKYVTAHYAS